MRDKTAGHYRRYGHDRRFFRDAESPRSVNSPLPPSGTKWPFDINSTSKYSKSYEIKSMKSSILLGSVLSCRNFSENRDQLPPRSRVDLNWRKIDRCFGQRVPDVVRGSINVFLSKQGKNCASICAFRANDECSNCYHYCEECLEKSLAKSDTAFEDLCQIGEFLNQNLLNFCHNKHFSARCRLLRKIRQGEEISTKSIKLYE